MKSATNQQISLKSIMMQPHFQDKHLTRPSSYLPDRSRQHLAKRERCLTEPRSRSIPIHYDSQQYTGTDLKRCEEEALADLRDYIMFRRIVNRISHQDIKDSRLRRENDLCLAHVIGIRNGSEDGTRQNYYRSDFFVSSRSKLDDSVREDGIFDLEL